MKITELDGKLPDVVIPFTIQKQVMHIPDFTPGDVHHLQLTPYSPYDIPGKYRQNLKIFLTPTYIMVPNQPPPPKYIMVYPTIPLSPIVLRCTE